MTDNKRRAMSLRAKILLYGIFSLCFLIICACAIIGFQVYQVNIRQYDQTSSQQFLLIEQTIDLFMQNNKNTVKCWRNIRSYERQTPASIITRFPRKM